MPISDDSRNVAEQVGFTETSPFYCPKFLTKTTDQVEKRMIHNLFNLIETGAFQVIYWDGTQEKYGAENPCFSLSAQMS